MREGTLGSDSGTNILVLFTLDADTRVSTQHFTADGVEIDTGVHPAYEMVRALFAPKTPPPLPGIIFISQFTGNDSAIYAELNGLADAAAVRERLRTVFAKAEKALGPGRDREEFTNAFASSLQAAQLPYHRSSRTSLREWLIRSYQFAVKYRSDFIAIISALP